MAGFHLHSLNFMETMPMMALNVHQACRALELGITHLDTSDMYGPHTNEILVGKPLWTSQGAGKSGQMEY